MQCDGVFVSTESIMDYENDSCVLLDSTSPCEERATGLHHEGRSYQIESKNRMGENIPKPSKL